MRKTKSLCLLICDSMATKLEIKIILFWQLINLLLLSWSSFKKWTLKKATEELTDDPNESTKSNRWRSFTVVIVTFTQLLFNNSNYKQVFTFCLWETKNFLSFVKIFSSIKFTFYLGFESQKLTLYKKTRSIT